MMDLIVTLERPIPGDSKRRVKEIVEIRRKRVDGLIQFSGLNVVYDSRTGHGSWAHDGAFLSYARDSGFESHVSTLGSLTKIVAVGSYKSDLDLLNEKMWSKGHPLNFVGTES
jgi:hypothetical protein